MGMAGVVSVLDPRHYTLVEELWAELALDFGVRGVYATPFPHFSYHVAETYDSRLLEGVLARFCRARTPFRVRTAGLALFTGVRPVLYVPVVRDAALSRFHAALLDELAGAATGAQVYYNPDSWMPHITIGFGDLGPANLGPVVAALSGRSFDWESDIDNVTLIDSSGDEQTIHWRFALGTGERLSPPAPSRPPERSGR